jgi:acyl carrier protein
MTSESGQHVDRVVRSTVLEIARQRTVHVETIRDDHLLTAELGFDSLDLAQLVAMLERSLGVDPFATKSIRAIRTVAELCAVYRQSCTD